MRTPAQQRTLMWCELLKAILEHRPVTLLERKPTHLRQLALPLN